MTANDAVCFRCGHSRVEHQNYIWVCEVEGCKCESFRPKPKNLMTDEELKDDERYYY